ncbi:noncanonical pyrimidine nucleotidase, YjjG family protein [Oscillospiraceae bacterium]|nr:noncanonical pyrimidine nucleotidase, YjjG family protein [Oscillospiraceae bacterium]BDF76889.1 noncanonical pyrimidine nucleotidase, YjjG family protein [Oscillospiraceae bacterium]
MPRYDYVLFDADNTLFDFDLAERRALRRTLERHAIPATAGNEALYVEINAALWRRFDRGEVSREALVVERFARFLAAVGCPGDPAAVNLEYLTCLGEEGCLLPGAEELCRALAPVCTLAIVTNGVALAQRGRFSRSPLREVIPWLFISEEVGWQKPQPEFFEAVLSAMAIPDRRRAVVVGDNLISDVGGALGAGLDAVWYNPHRLPGDPAIRPTLEAADFDTLRAFLLA